ncbi:MAG: FmdB family zinc ribbon protein [Candidatus Dormibacteraceae bacterium]
MPIYGYRCTSCGHEVEVLQSMSAAPLTVCEVCGSRLEKKLYPVGVHFKGTGFYSTDYKRSGQNIADGKSEEKAEKKSDGAAEKKTESKPAEKAASGSGSESKASKVADS